MSNNEPAISGGRPVRPTVLGYGGQSMGSAEKDAVLEVLEGEYITRGPTVEQFENRVANRIGVDHAIAVTSGTAALHIAGRAAGFNQGDNVITSPFTFAASAFTASYSGATPRFVDIDQTTRNLDPDAVCNAVTTSTTGLVPVHYAGNPCAIDELLHIANTHDLTIIWDACHAFGGTWREEPIGAQRDMAVFSFHPVKNITTAEGGMVVTDDDDLARRLRSLRSFEMDYNPPGHEDEPWYQVVEGLGYNYNFTDIQAALGLAQLDRIEAFKRRRDEIIAQYDDALDGMPGITTPPSNDEADPMCHLYPVEIEEAEYGRNRGEFVRAMHAENIGVQVHYVPLHYHPFFQMEYGYEHGDFPETEAVYERIVSLPLFPAMSDADIDDVLRAIEKLHSNPA